jgi:hypothetical protein
MVKRVVFPSGLKPRTIRGGRLKGMRCRLDLRQSLQPWCGTYEQCLQDWLVEHVRPGATCVDIGASDGYFSLLMAKLAGPSGAVYAFEPNGVTEIRANFGLNAQIPLARLEAFTAFVSATSGSGSVSIDELVQEREIDAINVVKIDVDGAEMNVIQGMMGTLRQFHPHLFVEVHSRDLLATVQQVTAQLGYTMKLEEPPTHEHRPIDYNVFFYSV